nr:hypothetical protein [uncultured Duganella sp.]
MLWLTLSSVLNGEALVPAPTTVAPLRPKPRLAVSDTAERL